MAMADYTYSLEFFDRQNDKQNLVLVTVVTLICIFGLIGNFHVVLVYTCRLKTKTTFKGCIVWLAVLDLLNCITVMPMDVTYFMHPYSVYNTAGCKMKHYLEQVVIFSAVAVTLVIAIDRYRKVCKPTYRQIRYREGRLLCGILVLVLALALTPVPVMMGMEEIELVSYNVTLQKCGIDNSYKDSVVPKIVIYFFVCVLYVASTAVVGVYFQLGKYLRQRNNKFLIPASIRRRISKRVSRKETFSKADLRKIKADPSYHPSPSPTSSTCSDESNFVSETHPRSVFHTRNSDCVEYQFDITQLQNSDRKYSMSDIDSGMATGSQGSKDRREIVNARKRKGAVTSIASMPDDFWPDAYETDEFMAKNTNDEYEDVEIRDISGEAFQHSEENGDGMSSTQREDQSDHSQCYYATEKYTEEITTITRNQIKRKPKKDLTGSCKSTKRLLTTMDSNLDASTLRQYSIRNGGLISEDKRGCNSVFYNRMSTNVNHGAFLSEKRERRQQRNNAVVKMCYIIAVVCLLCILPATISFLLTFAKLNKNNFGYVFVRLGRRSPYLRSCLNPFIYGFLDTKFRGACLDLYAILAHKLCGVELRTERQLSHRSTYRTHFTLNNMVHVAR
ncbi:dopamine receptor 3-like [Argopecten irradians]|uniref:dopamine receptor 3-like n=1 Tax=Argopecten irradians TaxID=31199 RepID=UPI00370FC9E6